MAGKKELDDALEVLTKFHEDIAILHCVSEYPTQPKNTNLNTIPYLKKLYPQYTIGYSDHTIGITAPVVAMSLGAEIIEKHITLDRGMKGTDQAGSLGPEGVYRMMRDIRIIEESMGEEKIFIADSVKTAREKLERSIASNKKLLKGHVITEDDIHLLSPGNGIKWTNREEIIGKTLLTDMPSNEILLMENLK